MLLTDDSTNNRVGHNCNSKIDVHSTVFINAIQCNVKMVNDSNLISNRGLYQDAMKKPRKTSVENLEICWSIRAVWSLNNFLF